MSHVRSDREIELEDENLESNRQIVILQDENERLRALLRQAYEGVTDEWHEWFKDDTYSGDEMAWLEATRRELEAPQ